MILLIMIILLIDVIIRNKDNSSLISDIFVYKYIFKCIILISLYHLYLGVMNTLQYSFIRDSMYYYNIIKTIK